MKHQHQEKKNYYDNIYYIVGLLAGLFTGGIIEKGFGWVIAGGVMGLLSAAFFLNVMVKGREEA